MALIALWQFRRSSTQWVLFAGALILAGDSLCSGLASLATTPEGILERHQWRLIILSFLPGIWILFSLTYSRGNARAFLTKWRAPLFAAFLLPPTLAFLFHNDLILAIVPTSDATRWIVQIGWAGLVLHFFLLVSSVTILTNLEKTFRASVGTMRWRIKFMLLGVAVLFTVRLYTTSHVLLFHMVDLSLQAIGAGGLIVAVVLMVRSSFRTGNFPLDVYPSQSVLEGSLTVLLAGIYLVIVGVFSKLAGFFGDESSFALKSFTGLLTLVVLTILLQSDRVRLRVKRFVSRHFQRPLYDYRTMWQKFNEGTACRVDRTDLCRSMVGLIAEMFQALSVTIWLFDEQKKTLVLAASTSLSEQGKHEYGPREPDSKAVIEHFRLHPEPVDIEASRSPWAVALREWHPGDFSNGGHRICVPLIARGETFGLITVGDRIGGATYSSQDFDLLKCVGDHAAASLLNAQLARKLSQVKEMEAFQTMAAFFVHDLKNAASTLNLMLQNLPVHFDDPAFREDTLRGMGKTVTHINQLIGRLSLLRHELNIIFAPVDLNALIESALRDLRPAAGILLVQDFRPLPSVNLDQEQMCKVITNLVLNAIEASPRDYKVRIGTERVENDVVLTVADEGSGMTPEFLQHSLFRPFQTTKKGGLGIGMFQSKMIIEAHGGRIAVASESGKGTVFQVFLPIASS